MSPPQKRADCDETGTLPIVDQVPDSHNLDELQPGTLIERYVIDSPIAVGGSATVYRATELSSDVPVAVKVLSHAACRRPDMTVRFLREAQSVAAIRHPNVIDIYATGALPDHRPYLVMELLEGGTLHERIREVGRHSPQQIIEILEPLAFGLQATHDAGIIHRDVKASNVGFRIIDNTPVLKLLDFGIAKVTSETEVRLTRTNQRLGTPMAMAPEQLTGQRVDARTDVYATGVLLYRLLTGEYPFRGTAAELEYAHLRRPAPVPSHSAPGSAALDAVVVRCLEKEPEKRFSSIIEVLEAFRKAVGEHALIDVVDYTDCREAHAIGILLQIVVDEQHVEDDTVVEDVASILDIVEGTVEERGFSVLTSTSAEVLAAKMLPQENMLVQAEEHRRVMLLADELTSQLAVRERRDARVSYSLRVHTANAMVRPRNGASTPRGDDWGVIVGGDIAETGRWQAGPHRDHVSDLPGFGRFSGTGPQTLASPSTPNAGANMGSDAAAKAGAKAGANAHNDAHNNAGDVHQTDAAHDPPGDGATDAGVGAHVDADADPDADPISELPL